PGKPRRQLRDVGPEHRDDTAAENGRRDVDEVVLRRCRARGLEARLLPQDRAVELLEARTRVDPELLDEHAAALPERIERLRPPPRTVEREHQLLPKALAERVLGDEGLELADDLRVPARRHVGVDPLL